MLLKKAFQHVNVGWNINMFILSIIFFVQQNTLQQHNACLFAPLFPQSLVCFRLCPIFVVRFSANPGPPPPEFPSRSRVPLAMGAKRRLDIEQQNSQELRKLEERFGSIRWGDPCFCWLGGL